MDPGKKEPAAAGRLSGFKAACRYGAPGAGTG